MAEVVPKRLRHEPVLKHPGLVPVPEEVEPSLRVDGRKEHEASGGTCLPIWEVVPGQVSVEFHHRPHWTSRQLPDGL